MRRVTEARISRLVDALSRGESSAADTTDTAGWAHAAAKLAAASGSGQLGRDLSAALGRYLNVPIRCSSGVTVSRHSELWIYEGESRSSSSKLGAQLRFRLALEKELALELADAMIGGRGLPAALPPTYRVKRMIEPVATEFLSVAARLADMPAAAGSRFVSAGQIDMPPGAVGGLCTVTDEFWWQLGVESRMAAPDAPTPDEWHAAVLAAVSAIQALVDCAVELCEWSVTSTDSSSEPAETARAALDSAGEPRAVLFADDEGIRSIASAALRAMLTPGPVLGQVATSVAHVVLRAALERFASELRVIHAAGMRAQILAGPPSWTLELPLTMVVMRATIGAESVTIRLLVASYERLAH